MNQILTSVIPSNLFLPVIGATVLNKTVIVPVAKQTAEFITTKTGLLTKSEAQQQADMFDDFIEPINTFLTDLTDDLLNIVTGGFYDIGMEFLGFKKDDVIVQDVPRESLYYTTPNTPQNTTTETPRKIDYNPPNKFISQRDITQEQFMKLKQMKNVKNVNPLIKANQPLNPYDNPNIAKRVDSVLSRALETEPSATSGSVKVR